MQELRKVLDIDTSQDMIPTMARLFRAFSVCFFLLLFLPAALSQQPTPVTEKEQKQQRERLQAVSMVKQTAAEAPNWNDKKAAIQALADAADVLWDETPGQGSKWLLKAWALVDQVAEPEKNERYKEFFNSSDRAELRTVVLRVARKHDVRLAEKFLKQLAELEPEEKKERGAFDDRTARSEQLLRLAQQAIDVNPALAFSFAEKSLADGISQGLQNVLTNLRKKNVDLANRLFDLALARFSSSSPEPGEGEVLAGYLFLSGITFSANSSGQTIMVMNPAQQNLPAVAPAEPQRTRNFLVAVYQSLLSRPISLDTYESKQRGRKLLVLGNRILGRYKTFAPEFEQPAQGFLAQLQRQVVPEGETGPFGGPGSSAANSDTTTKPLTKEELYEKRLTDLEDKADKQNDPTAKNRAYVEAALAPKTEEYQRAKRIAEKITDDNLRSDVISFLLYRAALSFVEKDEIEKAVEIAPQIGGPLRSAVVKIAIAQRMVDSKEKTVDAEESSFQRQRAFDLLEDVERSLKKETPSSDLAKVLLGRAGVLAKLDKSQALLALEQVIEVINRVEKFRVSDSAAPDLTLGVSTTAGATVARPRFGFDLRTAIEPLVSNEFETIAGIVERFRAKEVNGLARIEVARLYLRGINSPQTQKPKG